MGFVERCIHQFGRRVGKRTHCSSAPRPDEDRRPKKDDGLFLSRGTIPWFKSLDASHMRFRTKLSKSTGVSLQAIGCLSCTFFQVHRRNEKRRWLKIKGRKNNT